jgi:hypothetical protein
LEKTDRYYFGRLVDSTLLVIQRKIQSLVAHELEGLQFLIITRLGNIILSV